MPRQVKEAFFHLVLITCQCVDEIRSAAFKLNAVCRKFPVMSVFVMIGDSFVQ